MIVDYKHLLFNENSRDPTSIARQARAIELEDRHLAKEWGRRLFKKGFIGPNLTGWHVIQYDEFRL